MMEAADKDELDLRELLLVLWQGRWVIVVTMFLLSLLAGAAAFVVSKRYTATIVVAPVSTTGGGGALGGLGSLASQFGGLASLTGISLGEDSGKAESVAVLQSDTLTMEYLKANDLLPVLYASLWDAESRTWKTRDADELPTLWKANQYFKRRVRAVTEDAKTGMLTLSITWRDPEVAAKWANDLVKLTNDYLRSKKIAESRKNIAYLKGEAAKTDLVQVKAAIYTVLESEIESVMVAQGREDYALKVIDKAVPPERESFPQPAIWVLGAAFAGLALSSIFVVVRRAWVDARGS